MKSPPPARVFTWEEVRGLCHRLARLVEEAKIQPQAIIAILRGGAYAGLLLSHLLDVRDLYAIRVVTTVDDSISAQRQEPRVVSRSDLRGLDGKVVLVVDDVTNTGATVRAALRAIESEVEPARLVSAALLFDTVDPGGGPALTEPPVELVAARVHAWVTFPWEREKQRGADAESAITTDAEGTIVLQPDRSGGDQA